MAISPSYQFFGLAGLLVLILLYAKRQKTKLPLPPGPRPLPFVGNLFDMPQDRPWLSYRKWAKQYGSEIIHLQLPFQSVIILGSFTAAYDLLEKKSTIYSDKPLPPMVEIAGWDWNLALIPYGLRWRNIRRVFHQQFNSWAVYKYRDVQAREVASYLRRELNSGTATIRSINHLFSAIILDIVYGIQIQDMDDPFVTVVQEAVVAFNDINVPGAFLVDGLPFLRHIPPWVPGITFHEYGKMYRPKVHAMRDLTFDVAKQDIAQGIMKPSISHNLVNSLQERFGGTSTYLEYEGYAKDAVSVAYAAGVETSYSTTSWFILAMAMYPSVQEKAQHELDHVIGSNRLPTHEDFASLPYIQAILLECLRWMPAVPVGVPHRCMADDEYKGYRIPKGIHGRDLCRNPEDYPNPDVFDPDRFIKDGKLNPDVRDPSAMVFGFGRRICPGRHFAKEALLLIFASVLSVFNIRPALDKDGKSVQLTTEAHGGVLLHPETLDCVLTPRSIHAAKLISQSDQ